MPQRKLLLDTNAYLRLARSVHPLLFQEFGPDCTCLYLIDEFEREFSRSRRLQSQFAWVDEPEYRDNRRGRLQIARRERRDIATACEFIRDHADAVGLGLSPVDVSVLAHGTVLRIGVVTDDVDMRSLGETFGVEEMTTLALLKKMLDAGHVDIAKIRQIAAYWTYEGDLPADFRCEYRRRFREPPP